MVSAYCGAAQKVIGSAGIHNVGIVHEKPYR